MSLTHAAFALAGLIAAAGPVIIHLLNRRRFRTVEWGAMALLRKAAQRSRRAVRLRDLLLLIVRTAAVLLFGVALAQPMLTGGGFGAIRLTLLAFAVAATFVGAIGVAVARGRRRRIGWGTLSLLGIAGLVGLFGGRNASAATAGAASSRTPIHAVFVIDNSRSMATRTLGGTLLDEAKQRAAEAMGRLPAGSRIAVLPLCGPEHSYTLDAHRHAEDARAALERIDITDRSGSALRMLSLAGEASRRASDLPTKRIAFLGDQQATGWPRGSIAQTASSVGGPVHVVKIGPESGGRQPPEQSNVSIDAFEIQDGLAEADLPATFLAAIRCRGTSPAAGVEVTLSVDGTAVANQTVELRPGQSREVAFSAPLEADVEPARPAFVPATLSVRVPDPSVNRLERDDARHLAVPVVTALPVVFVDRYGSDENLDAGRIGETYRLRRLLAPRPAEGVYDPLVSVRHVTIEELNERTLEDARLVVVAGVERPTDDAVRLLRGSVERGCPLLIAAGADFDPAAWTETAWLDGDGILPASLAESPAGLRPSQATSTAPIETFRLDVAALDHPFFRIAGESAESLAELWRQPFFFQAVVIEADANEVDRSRTQASGSEKRPAARVLARFAKPGPDGVDLPYLVERRLGEGRALFVASGLGSDWDTLAQTNAIVLLDRITRSLLEETLPRRSFETGEPILLPIERRPDVTYTLTPPGREPRTVTAEATATGHAVRLEDTSTAGHYAVTARHESGGVSEPLKSDVFALNGPTEESDLTPLSSERLAVLTADADVHWVGPDDELNLTGGPVRGSGLWKWLAGAVLACLLAEMAIAARSRPETAR